MWKKKSPEEQMTLVGHMHSVIKSTPPPFSVPPPPDNDNVDEKQQIFEIIFEIYQAYKVHTTYRFLFGFLPDVNALPFFESWTAMSEAQKKELVTRILNFSKQKKRKREEEESKKRKRDVETEEKEASELKWLLMACGCGDSDDVKAEISASELLQLLYTRLKDGVVTDSLINKFCRAVVMSGKCNVNVECKEECKS
jgi:flagellar biosynthesis component FlhA